MSRTKEYYWDILTKDCDDPLGDESWLPPVVMKQVDVDHWEPVINPENKADFLEDM